MEEFTRKPIAKDCEERRPVMADALSGLFDAALGWKTIERDLALLIHIFYGVTVRLAKSRAVVRRDFIAEFEQTLLSHPGGVRIAGLLRDIDREWGSPLESAGMRLGEIASLRAEEL